MNRTFKISVTILWTLSVLFACTKEKILRKDQVATIMYQLFVADEYAKTYSEINLAADSILLYQHVFEKNGCTLEDYQRSIKHYLQDEKAYTYILDKATEIAKDSSAAASKDFDTGRHGLYFTVPYIAPIGINAPDDWWNKNFQGDRFVTGQFYKNLQRVLVKQKKAEKKDVEEPKMELVL